MGRSLKWSRPPPSSVAALRPRYARFACLASTSYPQSLAWLFHFQTRRPYSHSGDRESEACSERRSFFFPPRSASRASVLPYRSVLVVVLGPLTAFAACLTHSLTHSLTSVPSFTPSVCRARSREPGFDRPHFDGLQRDGPMARRNAVA